MTKNLYFIGIMWFIASLLFSSINDLLMKYLSRLGGVEIIFFRFFFASIIMLPFYKLFKNPFKTPYIHIHLLRAVILGVAITLWCIALKHIKITFVTAISFTIPIFVTILGAIFLKEKIRFIRIIACSLGTLGIGVAVNFKFQLANIYYFLPIISAVLFAWLDIVNKIYIPKESVFNMLFYSNLFTSLGAFTPTLFLWQMPTFNEVILLVLLGISANLILYMILKSFSLIEVSAIAPYRYLEFVFSTILGFLIFKEIPEGKVLIGMAFIIPATLILTYYDSKFANKN